MILSAAVLGYQLLFFGIAWAASRFGTTPLTVVTVLCLLWTATHLFFPPLVVVQTFTILASHAWWRRSLNKQAPKSMHQLED